MPDELELLREAGREVADPDEASVERARALLQRRIDAAGGGGKPFWRSQRVRRTIVLAVAGLLVGGFGFGLGAWRTPSGVAGTNFVGVGFVPAKGWTVVQSGTFRETGGPKAIAANVPLDPDDDLRDAPVATLESLPPQGVLITTTFAIRGDPGADGRFPVRRLPLRIADAEPLPQGLDPVPLSRGLARYGLRAGVGRYNVDARIYFGTTAPSPGQVAVAQSQLNRLVVASERVTIVARPAILGRDATLTLFGSVDSQNAEEIVTIEAKDCGQTSFHGVAAARTKQGGGWSSDEYSPFISSTIRAVWNDETSTPVAVQARPYVQLQRNGGPSSSRFEISVGAKVQFWRRYVTLQRFDRRLGVWKPIKNVVLTHTAAAIGTSFITTFEEARVAVPKGTLIRAVFPLSQARPCYLAGYSNQIRT